ncbi:Mu transposase C-terminal domain-containing protein [Domibacillus enclensis]|uniref:Transposase n=1 Tax=Domibacillus enclensis TaxID=1017273 RepID=A0A1N7AHG7_9BACI|nr:Mu transposase C-terminal domain-containing protein [Domibacillus enclensis]OXS75825.1 transposase [Domibacillus enclensis]SIR38600.1 Mu transposase, C-terminal [Domibacillus enclensis]
MIFNNQVYQYVNRDEKDRIRIIELDDSIVYYVELHGDTAMPKKISSATIEAEVQGEVLIAISDPYFKSYAEKDLSEKQIKKRDKDWQVVSTYWNVYKESLLEKKRREDAFEKIAAETNLSKLKLKRIFTRFWQRGLNKNALLPDYIHSGGKGKEKLLSGKKIGRPRKLNVADDMKQGINITEEVKKQFAYVIKKYYRRKNQVTLKETYDYLLKEFYSNSYIENNIVKFKIYDSSRIPTYNQFYYWFKKHEDPQLDIVLRTSSKEYDLKHRPILNNSTNETDGPGTRFQIDSTIADIYLVSSFDRTLIIGRPIIYAVIDVYSRMIAGIYVGLEGPSWVGAMMALDNMAADKVEFCKEYNIDINVSQWPVKHLPEIIIADRGEFEGYSVENLINNLNIKIENTSAYRGDLKGIVERQFHTINGKIKRKAPGAIQKEYRERGDRDYRLDANLNLDEFIKIVIHLVLQHNQKVIEKYPLEKGMVASGLTATPLNLWNWGIANKKGRLRMITDRNVFRLNLLPRGNARITRAGIRFKSLFYGSDTALNEQWYTKYKNISIEVLYDPRDMSYIYIPHADGKSYDSCYLLSTSEQYQGDTLEEIEFYQEMINELKLVQVAEQHESAINTDAVIEEIVKCAMREKRKVEQKEINKSEKLKNIRNNREAEKVVNRKEERFDLTSSFVETRAKLIDLSTNQKNDEAKPRSNSRLMEKLRKKRDEEFEKK